MEFLRGHLPGVRLDDRIAEVEVRIVPQVHLPAGLAVSTSILPGILA